MSRWFGVNRSTATRAIGEIRPLLAERDCRYTTGLRLRTLADVIAHLGATGQTGIIYPSRRRRLSRQAEPCDQLRAAAPKHEPRPTIHELVSRIDKLTRIVPSRWSMKYRPRRRAIQ
ncbi:hypothetical protein [Kitasatospora purpeofusca]|uniref:hypothetical protein n=1 Tax=Kitasatospora purpeofusca TaxID=67352 RepID=UPI0035DA6772